MKRIHQLAGVAAGLLLALQAQASITFELHYSDGQNTLNGQIIAEPIGGNQYQAVSGNLNVTASSVAAVIGSYSLATGGVISPSGALFFDNILYYPADPYLDDLGIVGLGFASATGVEIGLFSGYPPTAGSYGLYAWKDGAFILERISAPADSGITPVPEPSTVIAGALLLLPVAGHAFRVIRNRRAA